MKVTIPRQTPGRPGKRGTIGPFSQAARLNLLRFLSSINRDLANGRVWFCTLTQPGEFVHPRAAKKLVKELLRRFQRAFGRRGIIWKLEPQRRGAAHFHLLMLMNLGEDLQIVLRFIAEAWYELAGHGDPNHLAWHLGELGNPPCIQRIDNWGAVLGYAGKYIGKVIEEDADQEGNRWDHPGRYWGVFNKDLFPIEITEEEVPKREAVLMRRELIRWYEHQLSGKWRQERKLEGHAGRLVTRDYVDKSVIRVWQSGALDWHYSIRPIYRRWRGRSGGCTIFILATAAQRLAAWAQREAMSMVRQR